MVRSTATTTQRKTHADNSANGHVEPRVGTDADVEALDAFVAEARAAGRKVNLLARGGIVANDTVAVQPPLRASKLPLKDRDTAGELLSVVDYGLAVRLSDDFAIIAQRAGESSAKRITKHIFIVPRMELDFARILTSVDLVVHHDTCSSSR